MTSEKKSFIYGIRPVMEAISSGQPVDKVLIRNQLKGELFQELFASVRGQGIPFQFVPTGKLDGITRKNHQGVIAFLSPVDFCRIEDVLPGLFEQGQNPFLLILDGLTDVRNFGAVLRTAECAGVHAVIIPQKNFARVSEDTAKTYTDHLLMTSDTKITNEVGKTFTFLEKNYRKENYYHLIASPFYTRTRVSRLIKNEIENARSGEQAYIYLKLNNLVDKEIINLLYTASLEGVDVRLNIRTMFSLVPGIENLSSNIKAIGIVDRFLEHTRIMIFCNKGNEKVYLTSGDLMTRNIERRVEIACPVLDPGIKKELRDIFDIQWNDNVKARILDPNLENKIAGNDKAPLRSQTEIYKYLKNKHEDPAS